MELKYNSQLGQDKWVCETLKFLKNGVWVDVGCGMPDDINNTYVLEKELGWKGISIDINPRLTDAWEGAGRDAKMVYTTDAIALDYKKLFEENNMPKVIDYLTVDLEPPTLTLEALFKIPFDDYKFKCITYETDSYRNFDTVEPSREFIQSKGYKLVKEVNRQDDYWIHPDLV